MRGVLRRAAAEKARTVSAAPDASQIHGDPGPWRGGDAVTAHGARWQSAKRIAGNVLLLIIAAAVIGFLLLAAALPRCNPPAG